MREHGTGWPYTPKAQFWGAILVAIVGGGVIGWLFVDLDGDWLSPSTVTGVLVTLAISWLVQRTGGNPRPPEAPAYEHPILGLYAGAATLVVQAALDASPTRIILSSVGVGTAYALLQLHARSRTRRTDPHPGLGTTPTLTGWR